MQPIPKDLPYCLGQDLDSDEIDPLDSQLFIAYNELRHREKIEGSKKVTQTWRMKERMKTVSVALVLCLNVGVDPPDVVKTSPCARMECWIDPLTQSPQKALESIGANLQKQYERWQPRARYKQTLDPTVDEVKKLCTSLRRNAKDERVLFHYNGHGVPKPTANGEIWVFNKSYTQYIPLSIYDLQTWMGSPSIYVYDCSHAGIIVELFKQFSQQREQEAETANGNHGVPPSSCKNCIQLAACGSTELLPMNPELPADLFTSCLTTPIKIALRWYVLQNTSRLVPGLTQELVDKIPGMSNDRRTMLGELNWIFTAITDTIAWNTLPRDLFQKLFRQDMLVASLFRNFLLAERIMRSYNCTPVSGPKLPPTYQHPMWQAWDLALDLCLRQLPKLLEDDSAVFQHSPFFTEQLTAFDVWLRYGDETRNPPEQLPIVLQVLLSQVHRLRALELLGRFLDLGPWAVSLALSVGIFPYVLKLLQSSARELRPLLVFIWAKILSVDSSCQADLVKDNGHKYFLSLLADQHMPAKQKSMAAFVLAMIVNDYRQGQEATLQGSVIALCLEQLNDSSALLRQWLALCLAKVWTNFDSARWCGVRDSAHDKLYKLLTDTEPEVRAAVVYALGTFISSTSEKSDHASSIELSVGMKLISVAQDASPLVRKELVVALAGLVTHFESQFAAVAQQQFEDDRLRDRIPAVITGETGANSSMTTSMTTSSSLTTSQDSGQFLSTTDIIAPTGPVAALATPSPSRIPRAVSTNTLSTNVFNNVYMNVWKSLLQLAMDPFPGVANMAKGVVNCVKHKAVTSAKPRNMTSSTPSSQSAPNSPSNRVLNSHVGTPPQLSSVFEERPERVRESPSRTIVTTQAASPATPQHPRSKKTYDKGLTLQKDDRNQSPYVINAKTDFFEWCCKHYIQPIMRLSDEEDPESHSYLERQYRFQRNDEVRNEAVEEQAKAGFNRLDNEIFVNKNQGLPTVVKFHPFESELAVADKEGVSFWDWEQGPRLGYLYNGNPRHSRITALEYLNSHDSTLLLCGSDDGCVKIWRNYICDTDDPELVTAFQAVNDMVPLQRGSGLVTNWEQNSGMLLASGDARVIRIWDTQKEIKLQDIPTGADNCVTCLASDTSGRSLLVAGCGDGSVRIFDRRLAPSECRVMTLKSHSRWVLKVHLQRGIEGKIVTASVSGDVIFWDQRFADPVHSLTLQPAMTCFDIHPKADVLACGSVNQQVSVYNHSGDSLSTIKYHDGFMGMRIGATSCLAFHPYRVKLASGSNDSYISVYSVRRS